MIELVREALAGLSTEIRMAGLTVFILGLLAIARILALLTGKPDRAGS